MKLSNIDQSGLVRSRQNAIHPNLRQVLRRHLENKWLQPFHPPTVEIFSRFAGTYDVSAGRPFILDSGCGTGKSTQQLATQFPQHLVIGIDRSESRLAKSQLQNGLNQRDNCVLVRAELTTFWRLLLAVGYLPDRHFLYYPNPWPKARHLKKRWHGHPVFPQFLALGGEIEMRCNWEIYALEFALAIRIATGHSVQVRQVNSEDHVSPFEQKYHGRGHSLFSVQVPARVSTAFRLATEAP